MYFGSPNPQWPVEARNLSRTFARLGWAAFWVQVTFGALSILFMVYHLVFSKSPTVSRSGVPFIEYLTIGNMLVLLFTIFWAYRYTRLAASLADPERCPTETHLLRMVWMGVVASTASIGCSMLVMLIETATLLFFFLRAPQGGIPVVQTGASDAYWVSSVDMLSLMSLVLTSFAEVIVLVFSLWLLMRTAKTASRAASQEMRALEPSPG